MPLIDPIARGSGTICQIDPQGAVRKWFLTPWSGRTARWFTLFGGAMLTMLAGTSAYAQQTLPPIFDPTGRSGEPPAPLKKEFKPPTPTPRPTLPVGPIPPE